MRRALTIAATLCLGCGGQPPMTEIAIDPNLTVIEQATALEAAETWFQLVPAARLPVRIGENRGRGFITRDPCLGPDGPDGATRLGGYGAPIMYFCDGYDAYQVREIILHELAHALTLRRDHLDPGHVMSVRFGSTELTAADVAYVADVF